MVPTHHSPFYWMGCRIALFDLTGQKKVECGGAKVSRLRKAKRRGGRGSKYRKAILSPAKPEVSRVALADPGAVVKTNIHAYRKMQRLAYLKARHQEFCTRLCKRYIAFYKAVKKAKPKEKKRLRPFLSAFKARVIQAIPGSYEYSRGFLSTILKVDLYGWGASVWHPDTGSSITTAVPVPDQLELRPSTGSSRGKRGKQLEVRQCLSCGLTYQVRRGASSDCPKCHPPSGSLEERLAAKAASKHRGRRRR